MGDIVDFLERLALAQQTAHQDMHGKPNPSEALNPMPGMPGMGAPPAPITFRGSAPTTPRAMNENGTIPLHPPDVYLGNRYENAGGFLNPPPANTVPFAKPASSLVPERPAMRVPQIRDQNHLNQLLNKAEGDADLRAISQQMQKQGLDTSALGID